MIISKREEKKDTKTNEKKKRNVTSNIGRFSLPSTIDYGYY